MVDFIWMLVQDGVWSALAALGFAMLFNVPRHVLLACMVTGALGHALRTALMEGEMTIIPATLIGATAMGFIGLFYARHYRMPALVFTVSGAVTLVPGVFAFRTMIYLLRVTTAPDNATTQEALVQAAQNGITTGFVLAALAVGFSAVD